jgi:hypothetical protein
VGLVRHILTLPLRTCASVGVAYQLGELAKPAPGVFTECFRFEGKPQDALHLDASLKNVGNCSKLLGFETSRVRVGKINIHIAGAGKGCPLILLHGFPQSGEIRRHVRAELRII